MILNPAIAAQSQGAGGMITGELDGVGNGKTLSITFQTLPKLILFLCDEQSMNFAKRVIYFDILHGWYSGAAAFTVSGNTVSWTTAVNMPGYSSGYKTYYYAWL